MYLEPQKTILLVGKFGIDFWTVDLKKNRSRFGKLGKHTSSKSLLQSSPLHHKKGVCEHKPCLNLLIPCRSQVNSFYNHTADGSEIGHQLICLKLIFHSLQGYICYIHPRWFARFLPSTGSTPPFYWCILHPKIFQLHHTTTSHVLFKNFFSFLEGLF